MRHQISVEPAKLIKNARWEWSSPTTYWALRRYDAGMIGFVQDAGDRWIAGIIGSPYVGNTFFHHEEAMHWVETYLLVAT